MRLRSPPSRKRGVNKATAKVKAARTAKLETKDAAMIANAIAKKVDMKDIFKKIRAKVKAGTARGAASSYAFDWARKRAVIAGFEDGDAKIFASAQYKAAIEIWDKGNTNNV